MSLFQYGWRDFFSAQLSTEQLSGNRYARVCAVHRGGFELITPNGTIRAALARCAPPTVGDWVTFVGESDSTIITGRLKRQSRVARKAVGRGTSEQVVAANVDVVLIVMGLDNNYSLRRLERFLVLAWESGARPAVVLTKADLSDSANDVLEEVEAVALGLPVFLCDSLSQTGLAELRSALKPGETAVMVGSSGVGKSTLLNALYGEEVVATGAVREADSKGRHTTTHREMILLPDGGVIIDNPGVREIQPWEGGDGLDTTFSDVLEQAERCRFRDCTHGTEPGCAVREAIAAGWLDADRLANYLSMKSEAASLALRQNEAKRRASDRQLGRLYKVTQAHKRKRRGN